MPFDMGWAFGETCLRDRKHSYGWMSSVKSHHASVCVQALASHFFGILAMPLLGKQLCFSAKVASILH